jgi:teichuronic acid biosynthesis glycosyltransferase TuaG
LLSDIGENDVTPITFQMQLRKCRTPNSTMVVRRSLLLQHPFEEASSYRALEDHHCWLRCMENGKDCAKVMTPLMGYRLNENQISKSKWYMVTRLFHILKAYKLQTGETIGNRAYYYILTHMILGIYYRKILRKL